MDWELKASSAWDFTDIASEGSLVGSNGGDFSVDLKLGGLGGTGVDRGKLPKYPFDASSPSGSSKKSRAINGNQSVTCLVDGCMADLSGCREYHRRHRVCERHSKTPVVFVRGKEQRFCQQCSRFQSLAEFDEEKRSCRKRLDGHNRRRRKPQPEALYMNHGSFLSNHHQGSRLLQFSGPEPYITNAVPTWPRVTQHSSVPHHLSDKRFPFLLANDPERGGNSHQAVPQVNNVHPHRSHSLLSSPCLFHPSPFSPSTHQQQTGQSSMQFESPAHHQYSRSMPALVPQASIYENSYNGNELKMVSLSPDDLLEKGASQVLPYTWK